MKRDDLSTLKYIGPSRMKSLNELGITTIKQLCETPIEKLFRIPTIGAHYAKLIKSEAINVYHGKSGEIITPKVPSDKARVINEIKPDFKKKIKVLKKSLSLASEELKSLKKNKHQKLISAFKKRSETLMKRLIELPETDKDLPRKFLRKTVEKIDFLSALSKNTGNDLKKKKLKKLLQEIKSFSNMLKKTYPD